MDYNATLTIHANKPATENDDIDDVMEAFASYHPAVGDAPACPGALKAVITLPAHTLTQAVATATALAAQVGDLVGIEVIPTRSPTCAARAVAVATAWVSVWAGRVTTALRAPGHAGASPTAGW